MGDYGFKVSLPGKDITSQNPLDYVFHSKYGSVKVVQESPNKTYVTVDILATSDTILTIGHNLGFIPLVMVFTELLPGSGHWYNGIAQAAPEDNASQIKLSNIDGSHTGAVSYVDANNIYLDYFNGSGSTQHVKVYYYIFGDAGS